MSWEKGKKVCLYLRLSNDDERYGESASIENQKEMLLQYAKEQGWVVEGIYIDDGYSGTNQNRPGLQRMLKDVAAGKVKGILVKDLSRLGRNYLEVGYLIEEFFPLYGCGIISYSEAIDDMLVFRNWFNENHSKETSRKVKAVKKMYAEQGKFNGPFPPYGYQKSKENKYTLTPDPLTAPVVQRIFSMRSMGKGYKEISTVLNDLQIPPPSIYQNRKTSALGWNGETVKKMLQNEVYIGHMVQGKQGTISYKSRKLELKPGREWIRVKNTHESLIDAGLWLKVQEINKSKYRTKNHSGNIPVYAGLLICGQCENYMRHMRDQRRKDSKKSTYYICSTYRKKGKNACSPHTITEFVLDRVILDRCKEAIVDCGIDWEKIAGKILLRVQQDGQILADGEEKIRNRRRKLDQILTRLYEDKVNGDISPQTFALLSSAYLREKDDLARKRNYNEAVRKNLYATVNGYIDIHQRDYIPDASLVRQLTECITVGEMIRREDQKYCAVSVVFRFGVWCGK